MKPHPITKIKMNKKEGITNAIVSDRSHSVVFVNNTVTYLVNNTTYIGNNIKNSVTCFGPVEPSSGQIQDSGSWALSECTSTVSCILHDDGLTEPKHVARFLILLPILVVLLTK